jgi:vesicle coat complex subunit
MTSIIRVGQSKFVTVQIDEDSNERIMNCIKTLSELESERAVQEIFLADTTTVFSRMLGVRLFYYIHPFCVADAESVETRAGQGEGGDDEAGSGAGGRSVDVPAGLKEGGR